MSSCLRRFSGDRPKIPAVGEVREVEHVAAVFLKSASVTGRGALGRGSTHSTRGPAAMAEPSVTARITGTSEISNCRLVRLVLLIIVPVILAVTLGSAMAAGPRVLSVDAGSNAPRPVTEADFEKYHGFMFDLSDFADRTDFGAISETCASSSTSLRPRASARALTNFFHSVPIVASEMDCLDIGAGAACYGPIAPTRRNRTSLGVTTWDHARHQWTNPDMLELAAGFRARRRRQCPT